MSLPRNVAVPGVTPTKAHRLARSSPRVMGHVSPAHQSSQSVLNFCMMSSASQEMVATLRLVGVSMWKVPSGTYSHLSAPSGPNS